MLKNDLLKNDGEIIRIITIKNNHALVINCIKRNMPYWINIELLDKHLNWFQKRMYKICFGIIATDYTEE